MEQLYLKRLQRLSNWMDKQNIELALITSPTNIYYFTGFYSNPHERFMGLFIDKQREPILITPALDEKEAKKRASIKSIYGYSDSDGPDTLIKSKISNQQDKLTGLEEGIISYKVVNWLKDLLQFEQTRDLEEAIMDLRMIKDSIEINYMEEAARYADKAVEYGIEAIKVGKTELEVIAEIEYSLKKQGIEKMSFDTMVLTGLNSASPHGKPSKNAIKNGDFVLFDLGVVVNGYCSDISRTVIVGEPSEKQLEIYTTVKQAQQKAIDIVKPNLPIKQVDLTAREMIEQAGYGEYFMHRIGHGLGIDVHELPSMHSKNNELLREGMAFTIEPGIYLPDVGGVRIEDDIIVTESAFRVLTSFTKELIKI